jgi:cyclophilin family peptidyl-prolyl cis-trans isomerase
MTTSRLRAIGFGLALAAMTGLSGCAPATTETVGTAPAAEPVRQWSSPPMMQIDPSKSYRAVFTTEVGQFTVQLFADRAPLTVNNFVFLARQGYYDNTTFHRVIPGFMAQGGDPTGTGAGGPGYTFEDEFDPGLQFDRPGLLAMANRGPDTNGGQFFITYAPTPHLNGLHTIFGEVVEGAEIVDALTPRDPQSNPDFQGTLLLSVEIIETDG